MTENERCGLGMLGACVGCASFLVLIGEFVILIWVSCEIVIYCCHLFAQCIIHCFCNRSLFALRLASSIVIWYYGIKWAKVRQLLLNTYEYFDHYTGQKLQDGGKSAMNILKLALLEESPWANHVLYQLVLLLLLNSRKTI